MILHKADNLMNFITEQADRLAVFRGSQAKLTLQIPAERLLPIRRFFRSL